MSVDVTQDATMQANYFNDSSPQFTLSISSGTGGSTTPTAGDHQYTPQYVTVTANPTAGYLFDNWILDSVNYTNNPKTIPMTGNHTLQPYFVEVPPVPLTVQARAWGYPVNVNVWIDDEWVGYTDYTFYVAAGNHTIAVDDYPGGGWFFYYWDTSGGDVYTNPLELTISSATTITAEYCNG